MRITRKNIAFSVIVVACAVAGLSSAFGSGGQPSGESQGLQPSTLIGVAAMLVVAKLGGELFERVGQPAVLGELIGGIVLGNLVIFGFTGAESLKTNETIAALAELG